MDAWLEIVGIGEDGLAGLSPAAHAAIARARVLVGGKRHLAMVPDSAQERWAWPTPFDAGIEKLLALRGTKICVLASGDPMWFGIGATLARRLAKDEYRIHPAPSAFTLAAARMGWPLQDVATLSVHGRPIEALHPHIQPGAKLLVLSDSGETPAAIARMLCARGFAASEITVLEHMGGESEARFDGIADGWPQKRHRDLNVVAIACIADAMAPLLPIVAGLPDEAYLHDGQLTKRDMRAATLARLAPYPGALLWDVGAGCGSIGIEWMRAHPACRAIAIERDEKRRGMIATNAKNLSVPGLRIVAGVAPAALDGLETPDAVFIGGGASEAGMLEKCWAALRPGGMLVANAVTLQSEAVLIAARETYEGELVRISVAHASPVGKFDAWRTAMPVTILTARKPA
ncbi:MAG: precorrin-6y C5,15-methyltransferase (decarboxylating) subunit CbiE [Proteobacteria bacterium]|nr:precorrin-6y C5,15-methyltransferase (decarboxylating) subunit CbiE [Pseudomonadota bacterium]